jgi:TctA family transporter
LQESGEWTSSPDISRGFLIALTLKNVLYCFTGALISTLIGVLPGIGPLATIAMLMPFTCHVDPVSLP